MIILSLDWLKLLILQQFQSIRDFWQNIFTNTYKSEKNEKATVFIRPCTSCDILQPG